MVRHTVDVAASTLVASMNFQVILLIFSVGLHATAGSAQNVTTATSEFAPQSVDELKGAVDKCLTVSEDNSREGLFTFVMIPARSEDPIQEIVRSKAGGLDNDEVRLYMQLHYGFTEGGRLVVTGLDVPRPGNNHTFVSCYSDSLAQDSFPVNNRATSLVTAVRHLDNVIYGDAFISRSYGNDEARKATWERKDFFASDVDEKAQWVRDAQLSNHAIAEKLTNIEEYAPDGHVWKGSGSKGPVSWGQGAEEVEVTIDLPKGARARDVSVTIKYNFLKFELKNGYSMDDRKGGVNEGRSNPVLRRLLTGLNLFKTIDTDESQWTVHDNKLIISMTKKTKGMWKNLYST